MAELSVIAPIAAGSGYGRRSGRAVALLVAAVVTAVAGVASVISLRMSGKGAPIGGSTREQVTAGSARFSYGFDFAQDGPFAGARSDARAVASARRVLSSIPGMREDIPIMDWGMPDPEPSMGNFHLLAVASRIRLITSTGGTPVVTLCTAPNWMKNASGPSAAPTPGHYRDFAALAAKIAQSFPQVKYFVVWNELKGFWGRTTNDWNIEGYTAMYNDVYRAIKQVRPDARVGGPYANISPYAGRKAGSLSSTPHGAWGHLDPRTLNAIRYWLAHKAGADFIAVDGQDFPQTGPITDPLTATESYAAVDQWLRQQTGLPIWWMESSIQPADSGWSDSQAAAIRVAALIQMARSGASVGMQWQPQQGSGSLIDEGLWTATDSASGGKPTVLAQILPGALAVLCHPVTAVASQRFDVLAARGPGGAILINTSAAWATAAINGASVSLRPGQVRVTHSRHSCS